MPNRLQAIWENRPKDPRGLGNSRVLHRCPGFQLNDGHPGCLLLVSHVRHWTDLRGSCRLQEVHQMGRFDGGYRRCDGSLGNDCDFLHSMKPLSFDDPPITSLSDRRFCSSRTRRFLGGDEDDRANPIALAQYRRTR